MNEQVKAERLFQLAGEYMSALPTGSRVSSEVQIDALAHALRALAVPEADPVAIPEEVTARYWNMLPTGVEPICEPVPGTASHHLKWMLQELRSMTDYGKAMRWLGFIQGTMIAAGYSTVQAERDYTRPFFTTEASPQTAAVAVKGLPLEPTAKMRSAVMDVLLNSSNIYTREGEETIVVETYTVRAVYDAIRSALIPSPQEVSEEMVERGAAAFWHENYGRMRGPGKDRWPDDVLGGSQDLFRRGIRAALTAALSLQVKENGNG